MTNDSTVLVERIIQNAYGTEAGATAEETIQLVLDNSDGFTAHDLMDLFEQVAEAAYEEGVSA